MNNFRYQVLFRPLKTMEDLQTGNTPKPVELIMPTDIMAASDVHCKMMVARLIPAAYEDRLDQVEIIVKAGL